MPHLTPFRALTLSVLLIALLCPTLQAEADNEKPPESPRDKALREFAKDEDIVKVGAEQYQMFCAACHGTADTGGDSPSNLFDKKWRHGSRPSEIETVIRKGYLQAGMPPWEGMIPDEQIAALVAYLLSAQP